jgi:hypothetical protein
MARAFRMMSLIGGLLASVVFVSATAWSATGWVWLDESGRRVFSDIPPPASVPDRRILQSPDTSPSSRSSSQEPADKPSPATTPGAPAPASATPTAEATAETARENAAIERRNAEIRADNCKRAKEALQSLEKPGRLATLNEQGQRVMMTDASRKAEIARMQAVIRDNCR